MKLKLVIASMSVLGLVSGPLHAATTTKHHHKQHHKHVTRHHVVKHTNKHRVHHKARVRAHIIRHENHATRVEQRREHRIEQIQKIEVQETRMDYKAEVPIVCYMSPASLVLESAGQNEGRALPNPCDPGWYDRIRIAGGVNLDLGKFGNRDGNIEGENYQRASINDAYLNITASVTDWVKAFTSISFSNPTYVRTNSLYYTATPTTPIPNNWAYTYSDVYRSNSLSLEQAYVTISDFDQTPFYIQAGKQFQDFGRYEIHPITVPFTQVMSETLLDSLKLGVILPSGFNAAVYVFNDQMRKDFGGNQTPTNYGIAVGYDQFNETFAWNVGGAYLYNIIAANDISGAIKKFTMENFYHRRVGGVALYGDATSGPFSFDARWVSTIQRFSAMDLPRSGIADYNMALRSVFQGANGAKPWALSVDAAYNFNAWQKDNSIYIGYQQSREAAAIGLPKYRYLAGWDIEVIRNMNLGIEWDHDREYNKVQGGRNNTTNLFSLRTSVQFN